MSELFKNAKFGDKFRTRDGRCAILLQRYEGLCKMVGDANSGYFKYNVSDADGTALYPALGNMSIVSRWEEESDTNTMLAGYLWCCKDIEQYIADRGKTKIDPTLNIMLNCLKAKLDEYYKKAKQN